MLKLKNLVIAASALISIAVLGCTSEVVREVSVVSEVVRDVTVIVEKPVEVPVEVPVPQTVIVEKVVDNKILETVVVELMVPVRYEQVVEVPVVETVIVEKEVWIEVEVPVKQEVPVTVEVPTIETVVVEVPVTVEVPTIETVVVEVPVTVEVPTIETVVVEKPVTVEVPITTTVKEIPITTYPPMMQAGNEDVVIGLPRVRPVSGLPTVGFGTTPTQSGGVEDYFFHYEGTDPMTPELVEAWDIDPAGTRLQLTMRKGRDGTGIPFNSPVGYEDIDFGVADADNVVRYFNESNVNTNIESRYLASHYLSEHFLEASKVDDWTVAIELVSPTYGCLPISQFGCFRTERGLFYLEHADTMGIEWAEEHHIGTGSFVQDYCVAADRCVTEAVDNHWRSTSNIGTFTQRHVPDEEVRISMLRNGDLDLMEIDFTRVAGLLDEGYRFLETMPNGFITQSILFPGNLWEHTHPEDGKALLPWLCDRHYGTDQDYNKCGSVVGDGPYLQDYAWIGNPWGTIDAPCEDRDSPGRDRCGNAPYSDTDNRDGVDDMQQARWVRLALSAAIDRDYINETYLGQMGAPLYSEYMGPNYQGWDADRRTGCWDWLGYRTPCESDSLLNAVRWTLPQWENPSDYLALAGDILSIAGYPLIDGKRQGINGLGLQHYISEAGRVSPEIAIYITSQWEKLGIEIEHVNQNEYYAGTTAFRMRRRAQYLPILKNGMVYSNVYPLDLPLPSTDTSLTRSNFGWGVGFESQAASKWYREILSEPNKAIRERLHLDWVDYSMYWVQSAGVFQIPKGVIAGPRIDSWIGRHEHYKNISSNPEFIVLR